MTKNKKTIFMTGATGLLGSYLLYLFLEKNYKVYAVARGKNGKTALQRINELLCFWGKNDFSKNLSVIEGDITKNLFGINNKELCLLGHNVDEIYHCAAATQFNAPIQELRKINVNGTENAIKIYLNFKRMERVKKFHYISTAFVCGDHKGVFKEDDFYLGQSFNNNYEKSKFEAERVVYLYHKKYRDYSFLIYRPSIIVGDYMRGKSFDFKMFYEAINLIRKEIFEKIPLYRKTELNLISVDSAARAIMVLAESSNRYSVFHIVAPNGFSIIKIIRIAQSLFKFRLPRFIVFRKNTKRIKSASAKLLGIYISYFNFKGIFGCKETLSLLKRANFEYRKFDEKFLYRILSYYKNVILKK